jgi:hypothetical protein
MTALSSTEAEYVAMIHAAKQAIWTRYLLTALNRWPDDNKPFTLYSGNQGAIKLASTPEFHSRTKHIPLHSKHCSKWKNPT